MSLDVGSADGPRAAGTASCDEERLPAQGAGLLVQGRLGGVRKAGRGRFWCTWIALLFGSIVGRGCFDVRVVCICGAAAGTR